MAQTARRCTSTMRRKGNASLILPKRYHARAKDGRRQPPRYDRQAAPQELTTEAACLLIPAALVKEGNTVTQEQIYQNIARRTGGDIYLGGVGPVRTGKSTFIKRFSELMLLPRIKNEAQRARANDELPQSAGAHHHDHRAEVHPEKAVNIELSGGGSFRARLSTAWATWWTAPRP